MWTKVTRESFHLLNIKFLLFCVKEKCREIGDAEALWKTQRNRETPPKGLKRQEGQGAIVSTALCLVPQRKRNLFGEMWLIYTQQVAQTW